MRTARFIHQAATLITASTLVTVARAQDVIPICAPNIVANRVVATAAQREAAGDTTRPPLIDRANGFAWPDTPLGVIKTETGYAFFGSDGAFHSRQLWQGRYYGNNKYGSVTRTTGTSTSPWVPILPLTWPSIPTPIPQSTLSTQVMTTWEAGRSTRFPKLRPGRQTTHGVYAEIPTVTTQSFCSVQALAASSSGGKSWTDLGEIVRTNQAYRTDMDGFDFGDSTLVVSPDGKYFYIYFPDWLANGTTHWGSTVTPVSVARAPIASVLATAFGNKAHAVAFRKFYDGWHLEQGLGGYSRSLNPQTPYGGNLQVAYNAYQRRYQVLFNAGVVVYYAESPDGMKWSGPELAV
jgi:hypothetical protein